MLILDNDNAIVSVVEWAVEEKFRAVNWLGYMLVILQSLDVLVAVAK